MSSDLFEYGGHCFIVICDQYSGWPLLKSYGKRSPCADDETVLPIATPLHTKVDPTVCSLAEEKTDKVNLKQKWQYDERARDFEPLGIGVKVRVQDASTHLWDRLGTAHGIRDGHGGRSTNSLAKLTDAKTLPYNCRRRFQFVMLNYPKDSCAIDPKEIVEALFDILIWNPKEGACKSDQKRKQYYDRRSFILKRLAVGENVLVQNPKTKRWDRLASVINSDDRRKYQLQFLNGKVLWRNRRYIRQAPKSPFGDQTGSKCDSPPKSHLIHPRKSIRTQRRPSFYQS
ncbi:hypothetical protein TCAL_15361 [Tigriopus californicus]|uniref:Uncharacterized protein n=1 Tax=Tigriopus californicus TaxID=6832 RepID=A0A553PMI5_TIGCA|nr:hypothetical protein TCAL_15361 [Tigriopus californicus]